MNRAGKDRLDSRMKRYEQVNERFLVPKEPFIIRVDGCAFRTYTKGLDKPFDRVLGDTMIAVTEKLCKEIPGAVFGYTQSDEITIICNYTNRLKSEAWFDGRVRKIETVSAAKATKWFNKLFTEKIYELSKMDFDKVEEYLGTNSKVNHEKGELTPLDKYIKKIGMAEFDARVFNIPEWDCINNIIFRQSDGVRNSVSSTGHAYFSAKELNKVGRTEIKERLIAEKGVNWEKDFDSYEKNGAYCYKVEKHLNNGSTRSSWHISRDANVMMVECREWFSEITGLQED